MQDADGLKGYNIVSGKLSFEFSHILDPDDVSPTLVATDMSKIGVDGKGIRCLTIREGLRLFGFPETYKIDLPTKQAYDLLGISTENEYNDTLSNIYIGKEQLFRSIPTDGGNWNKLRWRMDKFYKVGEPFTNEQIFEAGSLRVNDMIPKTSLDYVIIQPKKIAVKIPWSLLQVTDPTTLTVISDNRDTNNIRETEKTQGIALSVSFDNSLVETQRYKWQGWDYAPPTKEYTKAGYLPFKEGVKSLPDFLQN
jgi:hypothetical protein